MKNMQKITNYRDERDFVLENVYGIAVLITLGSDYFIHACLACKSNGINHPANAVYLPAGKNGWMINSAIVIGSVTVHENSSQCFIALAKNTYEFVGGRFPALGPLKMSLPYRQSLPGS